MDAPPPGVQRDHPLARLTTIRTGGRGEWFARPATVGGARTAAGAGRRERSLEVGVVGSGSNLLIADEGVRGLVIKLDGELSRIEPDGDAAALRRRRAAAGGLGARGAARAERHRVRGQHPRDRRRRGADERQRLRRASWPGCSSGSTSSGPGAPSAGRPEELGFAYRRSNLRPGEVVAAGSFALEPAEPAAVKATLAEMRGRRREAQPSGIKTFGSTFKNPDDPRAEGRTAGQLLEAAGCRGLRVGGAGFSEKHANFVENLGDGDDGRRGRADGRGPAAGPGALRGRARARGADPRSGGAAGGVAPMSAIGRRRALRGAARVVRPLRLARLAAAALRPPGVARAGGGARCCSAAGTCGCATRRWSRCTRCRSPATSAPTSRRSRGRCAPRRGG